MKLPNLKGKININNMTENNKKQEDLIDFEQQINRINNCKFIMIIYISDY
jgi:hypothetical protein